jgi:hypothetical protein
MFFASPEQARPFLWLTVAVLFVMGALIGFGRAESKRRGRMTVRQGFEAAVVGGVVALLIPLLYWLFSSVLYRLIVTGRS